MACRKIIEKTILQIPVNNSGILRGPPLCYNLLSICPRDFFISGRMNPSEFADELLPDQIIPKPSQIHNLPGVCEINSPVRRRSQNWNRLLHSDYLIIVATPCKLTPSIKCSHAIVIEYFQHPQFKLTIGSHGGTVQLPHSCWKPSEEQIHWCPNCDVNPRQMVLVYKSFSLGDLSILLTEK